MNIENKGFRFLYYYLYPYKKLIYQLIIGFLLSSLITVAFPFLTQSIIDIGVNQRNIGFIYSILLAQLILFFSQNIIEFLRSWLFLHIGTRVNISLISNYLKKLMCLPISFFDNKVIGDLLQRIYDHSRIQNFLSSFTLNFFFSILNFILFCFILIFYSIKIFILFIIGSFIGITWILFFLNKRKKLDKLRFDSLSDNQNKLVQIISGIQEIKLNNSYKKSRKEWEKIQGNVFKINIKGLTIAQFQQGGSLFINNLKNILIIVFSAKEVIDGNMTLGMMLAISYIMGQLNAPIEQFLSFVQNSQDAKLSLNRISEVHMIKSELLTEEVEFSITSNSNYIKTKNIYFKYDNKDEYILNNINIILPVGKTTAIIGESGSGKSTLLKLLLKFYSPTKGEIYIGNNKLEEINTDCWRNKCGAVLQDGYIFNDSIQNNIALCDMEINKKQLDLAIELANVSDFIRELPNGIKTKIGINGHGISQGQKQRILIARAIYKNPEFLIFDEATSNLDISNESIIMENIKKYFKEKTFIIIAHKINTLRNADQIIVLDKGIVKENGSHQYLMNMNGDYHKIYLRSI
jgi:ATP-binding cassette, subfamily B, bacterial